MDKNMWEQMQLSYCYKSWVGTATDLLVNAQNAINMYQEIHRNLTLLP